VSTNTFSPTSRYYNIETGEYVTPGGKTIVYLRRRRVPQPEELVTLQEHVVLQNERLDNITADFIGDPEQFWRLCDANNAMKPEELEETGRVIRITLPEGIPGNS
jgi:hypothetical protein